MRSNIPTALLRIFISSTDHLKKDLLCESIVFAAKNGGIAGVTVLKGILGYGASSVIHSYKFWEVTDKLPIVIEIIDEEEKIRNFYETIRPQLESMRYGCLVTIENVEVLLFKSGKSRVV
jgi:PII-like signaling protein